MHYQAEGRHLLRHRGQTIGVLQSLNQISVHGAVVGPQPLEKDPTGEPLLGPLQRAVRLLEGLLGMRLAQPRPNVHLVANKADDRERRQQTVLLPTQTQKLHGGLATPLQARAPRCGTRENGRQKGEDQVEDAQGQQRRGAHEASLGAFVVQSLGLEEPQPQPRPQDQPNSLGLAALQSLNDAHQQHAQAFDDGLARPILRGVCQLVRFLQLLQGRGQLIVLQRRQAVQQRR
mmetsp:Transcript_64322/g.209846  ORF Transcript_64322/g.209846 Transcript_64322/m.209846 type:complete len:232 (+) Transcript_64322:1202-1897(+)